MIQKYNGGGSVDRKRKTTTRAPVSGPHDGAWSPSVSPPSITLSQTAGGRAGGAAETEQAGKAYEQFVETMKAGDDAAGLTNKQIADAYTEKVLGIDPGTDKTRRIEDISGIETVDYTSDKKTPDEKKGIVETIASNTMVANLLKGVTSTDRFFKALAEKGAAGLSTEDKIILANLIGAGGLETLNLNKYAEKYNFDAEELGKRFTEAASGLENVDYQSLIDQYLDRKPEGFKESLGAMYDDFGNLITGTSGGQGIMTLENLKKELGPQGLAFLKANDPAAYYSFMDPQTSGSIEDLANIDASKYSSRTLADGITSNPNYNPDFANQIFAAREQASRQKDAQDRAGGGGGGAGIANLAPLQQLAATTTPATTAATTTPATTAAIVPAATTTAATMTTPTPFDYSQWPQFDERYPGHYANWGIPSQSWPQYDYWNQIAKTFPGMT